MTTQSEAQGAATTRWAFDPYHTQVEFAAKHLGMMTVRGHFADVTASGNIYPCYKGEDCPVFGDAAKVFNRKAVA